MRSLPTPAPEVRRSVRVSLQEIVLEVTNAGDKAEKIVRHMEDMDVLHTMTGTATSGTTIREVARETMVAVGTEREIVAETISHRARVHLPAWGRRIRHPAKINTEAELARGRTNNARIRRGVIGRQIIVLLNRLKLVIVHVVMLLVPE